MQTDNIAAIIKKAERLSELLENHEITLKYKQSLEVMKSDRKAQELLAKLVLLGREINGTGESTMSPSERAHLTAEFEANPLVREHILNEKEYLKLVTNVQERIKNPQGA